MSLTMQGERTKRKKRISKTNRSVHRMNLSQERASYFFFTGLLIIAIFSCVASGAPKQGFYGIIFLSIGILVAIFPPSFVIPRWLNFGLLLFFISLSTSLLPRSFGSKQSWRIKLESLGLETGSLITPHPAATIESLIIVFSVILIGLCSLGHRISRDSFLKITTFFVVAVAIYSGISMLFLKYEWQWQWDPNNQFGFFANRNHMATLMVMGSLAGVGSLFIYLKKSNWAAFTITLMSTSIICWAILGYSISRAGLILFISFQMIWFLCVGKKHLNYKLVTSFLILFTLAVILFVLSDTHLEKRLDKLVNPRSSNSKILSDEAKDNYKSILGLRKYIHLDTYNMIKSEPWTGTGLGTYEFIFPFYKKESTFFNDVVSSSSVLHPESNWLDLTSQAGILSAITCLIIILAVIFSTAKRNKKSRSWLLVVSCLLSVICLLTHGFIDVPGQKIGITLCGILLIGITLKPQNHKDKITPRSVLFVYQIAAIAIFSIGLTLIHSQWFNSKSIVFSDNKLRQDKIQNLYSLSIDSARNKNKDLQKDYLMSAINLTENAIKRSPLDPDLHFIKGKLYSFLEGYDEKIKSSFEIESSLDPSWCKLPLRQSNVWLFISIKETRRLWIQALKRSEILNNHFLISTWDEILSQAKQHPIQIRDTYKIILFKDDAKYIKKWMNIAGNKNLLREMPNMLGSALLTDSTKKELDNHWKKLSPNDYKKYKNL